MEYSLTKLQMPETGTENNLFRETLCMKEMDNKANLDYLIDRRGSTPEPVRPNVTNTVGSFHSTQSPQTFQTSSSMAVETSH